MSDPDFSTRSIGQLWDAHWDQVLQAGLPPDQVVHAKKAFYCASYALLKLLADEVGTLPDPQAGLVVQGLFDETRAMLASLGVGRAEGQAFGNGCAM